jgi:hypothetical protein
VASPRQLHREYVLKISLQQYRRDVCSRIDLDNDSGWRSFD